jgi:hypothetical protein
MQIICVCFYVISESWSGVHLVDLRFKGLSGNMSLEFHGVAGAAM